jgi:hypothetical protein
MHAAVLTKANTPWEIKDVDEPKPGPGQVVIRVHASGMCSRTAGSGRFNCRSYRDTSRPVRSSKSVSV